MNKYRNIRVTVDGVRFDSVREADRWRMLRLMEQAGQITDLKRQVRRELIPAQYIDGRCAERAITYTSDFEYRRGDKLICEDVKGIRTAEYVIKRKLMLYIHGIRITEI